ncbi:MAG: DMT family transporter [bacterium]|nr:DMT family transporter [bacterium]
MNKLSKGFLLAFLCTVFLPVSAVITKYILNNSATTPETLVIFWFFSAFIAVSLMHIFLTKESYIGTLRKHWKPGLFIGLANTFAAIFWFNAIEMIGPVLVGFITRFEILFTIILGMLLLRERLTKIEILGMFIAIVGTFTLTFGTGKMMILGVILAAASSLAASFQSYVAKRYVKKVHPMGLLSFRCLFTVVFVGIYVFATGKYVPIEPNMYWLVALGPISGAVIAHLLFFYALKYIDMTKAAIVRSFDAFFVVVYALILFGTLPTLKEVTGGILIIIGVALATMYHRWKNYENRSKS